MLSTLAAAVQGPSADFYLPQKQKTPCSSLGQSTYDTAALQKPRRMMTLDKQYKCRR